MAGEGGGVKVSLVRGARLQTGQDEGSHGQGKEKGGKRGRMYCKVVLCIGGGGEGCCVYGVWWGGVTQGVQGLT